MEPLTHWLIDLFPEKKARDNWEFQAECKREARQFLAKPKLPDLDEGNPMAGKDILSILGEC